MPVQLKRAYEPATPTDGRRDLVDRLWPRGVSAPRLQLEGWLKELAPSDELRRWYGHVPERFPEFRRRYRAELADQAPLLDGLRNEAMHGPVTLVFASRDPRWSNAAVLAELLRSGGPARRGTRKVRPPVRSRDHRGQRARIR